MISTDERPSNYAELPHKPKFLTHRQYLVLLTIAFGWKTERVANAFGLTVNSVKKTKRRLFEKMEAHSGGEAIHNAWKIGIFCSCHPNQPAENDRIRYASKNDQ